MNNLTVTLRDKTYTLRAINLGVQVRAMKHYFATGLGKGVEYLMEIIDDEAKCKVVSDEWVAYCNSIFVEEYTSPSFFDLDMKEIQSVTENFFKSLPEKTKTQN